VALGLLASRMPGVGSWVANAAFFVLAGVTVAAAAATITVRNPVYAAIWFGLTLAGTAGLMLLIGAQFLAAATLIVYAGAILVTFLFVLMLANPTGRDPCDRLSWEALLSSAAGMVLAGTMSMTVASVLSSPDDLAPGPAVSAADRQEVVLAEEHVRQLGLQLFGPHLLAVEVAGTLLLAALVGAAVIVAPGGAGQRKEGKGDRQP
ncbi:MAG TPA: hypothetical protein EYH34_01370, partial [Planctomycetes bacterium]|nr:hypothetical protein [Planctomycetota bacterium]